MKCYRVFGAALALILIWTTTGYAQQTAEELFQAGLHQEEVQGDLETAIESYQRILDEFSGNRAVGANAQLHIGLCSEKLGLQDARQAYRRVIDDFPEHADQVRLARERLASLMEELAELNRGPTFRKIEIASNPQNGVLSPDGLELAFVSEEGLWVVPLHGDVDPDIAGEPVQIAEVPGAMDRYSLISWSADGGWIAVNTLGDEGVGPPVVVPVNGGEPRVVRLPVRGGHVYSLRLGLSPHGEELAFSALPLGTVEGDYGSIGDYIFAIPTLGGEPRQLSSSWGRLPSFSPDGEFVAYVGYRERDDWGEDTGRSSHDGDLWVAPSAGGAPWRLARVDGRLRGPVWSPDGRFIAAHLEPGGTNDSRELWVFPLTPEKASAGNPVKLALPRSSWNMLAGWTPSGQIGVFIDADWHNAVYTVPASGGKAVQVSPEVSTNYTRWSADGERIYFRKWAKNVASIAYVPSTGGEVVEVPVRSDRRFESRVPGGGHNIAPDGNTIVVSAGQEPWDFEEGVDVWTIPLDGGPAVQLTHDGSFEGYPCWSPDGRWIAFSDWVEKSEDEGFDAIFLVPAEGGEARQLSVESDSVGAGAIAFSPDGERIAFFSNGMIKTIPHDGGQPEIVVVEARSGTHSDMEWSPSGERIAFSGGGKIWVASVGGGEPEALSTGLPEGARYVTFGWSPDGERIVFNASIGGKAELWLISNFLR